MAVTNPAIITAVANSSAVVADEPSEGKLTGVGTKIGNADTGTVKLAVPMEEVILLVYAAEATTFTVYAGDNPPALSAGQGNLTVSVGAGDVVAVGPFTSARFIQAGSGEQGYLNVDPGAKDVYVTPIHVPRTA